MEKYILYGCGGFATEIVQYLQDRNLQLNSYEAELEITDVVDASRGRYNDICTTLGYLPKLHKSADTLEEIEKKNLLVCLGNPTARHQKYQHLKKVGHKIGTLVHPTAWVASNAKIEEGSIICPFSFIGPNAHISPNCVVNVRATIGHDVKLGASTVICPHADLNGASVCGEVSFVGAGSIFDPSTSIGRYSQVTSGSVVKQKFGDGFLVTGSPAKGRQMFKLPE